MRSMHCSMEQGSTEPNMGAPDVVVGEGELIFAEVIPLGVTKLYLTLLV